MGVRTQRTIPTREKRTAALSNYHGTLRQLIGDTGGEIEQRLRTFSQTGNDEIIYALSILATIRGASVVLHGGTGCSAAWRYFNRIKTVPFYTTDLNERDTILGGGDKLEKTVRLALRYGAAAVFIVGTPVTAISNDDVTSVISELSEETDTPVLFINTDGFKSKTPVTGYDIVFHAFLRYLIRDRDNLVSEKYLKKQFINLISVSESVQDLTAVTKMISALGIRWHLLPLFSSIDGIQSASLAAASIAVNRNEGELLGEGLRDDFGVPYLETDYPASPAAVREFLMVLGEAFEVREKASVFINQQEESLREDFLKQPLAGKSFFLELDVPVAKSITQLILSLGGTVSGYVFPYVDEKNRRKLKEIEAITAEASAAASDQVTAVVANGQPFEVINALSKLKPDYYAGNSNLSHAAARLGIIPFYSGQFPLCGYDGIHAFVDTAFKLKCTPPRSIKDAAAMPDYYKEDWIKRRGNWYIKREVN